MLPSFDLLGRTIPAYGLMAAAGIVCGLLFVTLFAKIFKLDVEGAVYIYTFGFIGAGIGAKILYLILSVPDIAESISEYGVLKTTLGYIQGGMVFYGGLLGAIAASFLTARFLKYDIREYYPPLVPGICILAGFGRIGCFLAGCCYGAPAGIHTHFPVVFPEGSSAPAGVPLIPVQLYEALFEGVAAAVLAVLALKVPKQRRHLLALYLCSYAVFRFILEFYRADSVRGIWGPFSTSQWISIAILLVLFIKTSKDARAKMLK